MLWEPLQKLESVFSDYSEVILGLLVILISLVATPLHSTLMYYLGNSNSPLDITSSIAGIIFIILFGVTLVVQHKNKQSAKILEAENTEFKKRLGDLTAEDTNHQQDALQIVDFLIRHIGSQHLKFGTERENNERISLYVHDGKGFFPIARFSQNPEYNKKSRKWYPIDQGIISKAWHNGEYFKQYTQKPGTEEYYEFLERDENIPQEVSRQFKMKPWLIYGFRIGDPDNPVAIFIVESTSKQRYRKTDLKNIFTESPDVQICIEILLKLRLPNPNIGEEWEDNGQPR